MYAARPRRAASELCEGPHLPCRRKTGKRRGMKRPIAELLVITLNAGAEAERAHVERAAWQILRRKQGYVTHRIYRHLTNPLQRLVYSEWESAKVVDGARQYLQGTPLMRHARTTLAAAPQRSLLEITGPITSTKGLDLPDGAVAACARSRLNAPTDSWREKELGFWKNLASQPGHVTHVLLRGTDDRVAVGSLSHWADAAVFQKALAQIEPGVTATINDALTAPVEYVLYGVLRE